jgi:hypothetical protein
MELIQVEVVVQEEMEDLQRQIHQLFPVMAG